MSTIDDFTSTNEEPVTNPIIEQPLQSEPEPQTESESETQPESQPESEPQPEQQQTEPEPQPQQQPEEQTNKSSDDVTIKINKESLISLIQSLNTNLLVNIGAYKGVLNKLKTISSNDSINGDIDSLNSIESNVAQLFTNVQTNLDVSQDKIISPEKVIEEANKTTALTDQLISAQVSSILAGLAATAILLGGKRRKHTRKHFNKKYASKGKHRKTRRTHQK